MARSRKTIADIKSAKKTTPIVCLTAYTAPVAEVLDPHVDILLVGDSLGMVLYGMESTLGVTLDMMSGHGAAVVNASTEALVVVDMPFGSYQKSKEQAYGNCSRVIANTGCTALKLEGGEAMAETIHFLTDRGIPVMGHIGLLPQSVHQIGGYRYQGRTDEERQKIVEDAQALEDAGVFSIVLEGVVEDLAKEITEKISIPTIGIGASAACDGQVLVVDDMAGMTAGRLPKFVKQYGSMRESLEEAVKAYADEVRNRTFPGPEHCYKA